MTSGFYLQIPHKSANTWRNICRPETGLQNRCSTTELSRQSGSFPRIVGIYGQTGTRKRRKGGLNVATQEVAQRLPSCSGLRGAPRLIWHKRRGRYYIRWQQDGKSMLRGTGTAVLEEAEASFRHFLRDPVEFDRHPRRWTQPMIPLRKKRGAVYFIGCKEVGRVKIGFSEAAEVGLAHLQCGSPVDLVLLATMPGTEDDERELHKRFAACRLHGEWFERTAEIEAEIARLNSGDSRG